MLGLLKTKRGPNSKPEVACREDQVEESAEAWPWQFVEGEILGEIREMYKSAIW